MPPADAGSKPTRFLAVASVGVVVAGLYLARDVMIPIAVALLLTFLLTPLVHRLERLHLPRIPAVLLVVILAFGVIGGIIWLISGQATDLAIKISSYQGDIEHKIERLHGYFGHGALAKATASIDKLAADVATSRPSSPSEPTWANRGSPQNPISVEVAAAPSSAATYFSALSTVLDIVAPMLQSVIVIVFVIFMLMQREDIRDRVIRLMGHGRLSVTTRALDDAATRISSYLLAQSAINGTYGLIIGVGLYFIGVPNAALWGLLCALLRFIPYVGIWIAAIFPIVLSLVVPDHSYAARPFLTIGLFVLVEIVAANVVEPLLFSSSIGVTPLAILVAAVFWTWLWGPVGLLLSTPLTVLLAVAGKYVPQLEFLTVLLGDQPVLSPPERYYQRLLAEDTEEAEDLLEEFEKEKTPGQIYSEIMLPALQMMERDFRRGVLDEADRNLIAQVMRDQAESPHRPASRGDAPATEPATAVPRDCTVRVLCLPARNTADEIAGVMLTNLLAPRGYCASCLSAGTLASEMVDAIEKFQADLVLVSSTPPNALTHSRYLCKKIRAKYPELRLLVGFWNTAGDLQRLESRLSTTGDIRLVSKLDEAIEAIHQMAQPLLIRPEDSNPTASADPQPQTAPAS